VYCTRFMANSTQAYNRITQRDSKVMLDISSATKSDSKAMKTVALVTMVFLPATFTSVRPHSSSHTTTYH
jgi:Mg2+ and Co2+ transporter CorA